MKSLILKIALIIYILFFSIALKAQEKTIEITTQIFMPYSPYFADYFGGLNKLSVIVRNHSPETQKVKIGFSMVGDNGVKISSKEVFFPAQPLILNPNQTVILNNSNIKNYTDTKNFDVSGFDKTTLLSTGMLPDGNYDFCFRAYNYDNGQPLSPENPSGCANIDITYPEAPILLQPGNEDSLITTNILFTWIGSPQAPIGTQYKLQITEMLLPDANADAVMKSTSRFFFDKTITTTNYLSLPNDPPLTVGKTYAWRVIAFDATRKFQFRNNGVSEAWKFTLKKTDVVILTKKEKEKGKEWFPDTTSGTDIKKSLTENDDTTSTTNNKKSLPGGNDTTSNKGSIDSTAMGNDTTSNTNNNKSLPITESNDSTAAESPPTVKGNLNPTDTLYAGQNGEFVIIANSITGSNGMYSGKGTAYINWLMARVAVEFDSICVDSTKKLTYGEIIAKIDSSAPVYPQDWAIEVVANLPFTNNLASSVISWVKNKFNQTIPYNGATAYTTPVKLPLGVNFPDSNQLAITEMVFRSDKSEFNMVAAKTTPPSWGTPQLVGFIAKNIKFHPSSIQTPPERIELVEDIAIGNTNANIVFSLKKPDTGHSGCYVEWGETGFSEFGIEIEAAFTRNWLIPSPDDNSQVSATLIAVGADWNSMILTGWMKKSEIIGTNGMTILADSLSYDMSDISNPASISFPQNYPGDSTILFRGFFMKNLVMEMPDTWKTMNNTSPQISIQNMIIDNMGITFKAKATNVVQFPNANVADLSASIDTVVVNMVASSLTNASIKGKIGLPVSKNDSIQNPLKYVALLSIAQNTNSVSNFQLTIVPTGPIYAHLLKGTLDLAQTSNITAYVDKTTKKFDMVLNGNFGWNNITLGPVKNVDIGLKFQNLGFNYNSSTSGFTFNAGSWSFASVQKFMANFPVTIKNIGFKMLTAQPGEMVRGKLNFDVIFNLSDVIGGMTKLGVELAIEDETNGQKFYPKYVGTTLDSISIYTNMSAVKIDGSIAFINGDPVFGDGFKGNLSAKFNSINMYISVGAFFGNTSYQSNSRYRYWKVEALAILPPPGIVFMAGLAFRGFGVAAYHHMLASYAAVSVPAPTSAESMSTTSGAVFTPSNTIAFGFKVKGIIATTPKEETFNADVGISGEFTNSGGMTFLRFDGDFWVGAGFAKRADAFMNGSVVANYDFPLKTFYLGAAVGINKDPISTPSPVTLELLINGKDNLWHFIAGKPTSPNTIKILNIPLTSYAMFGNDIIPPPNFMPQTISGYAAATNGGSLGSLDGALAVNDETKAGKGFAFGVGISDGGIGAVGLTDRLSIKWNYSVGGELNLSLMEYGPGCIVGMNGWYAKGNVAIYGGFSVSGHVAAKGRNGGCTESTCLVYCCKNYPNGYDVTIGSFGFGLWASGGFPKPTYLKGAADITYNVLDLVSGSYHGEFQIGNACNDAAIGIPSNFDQEDVANEQKQQLIVDVLPSGNNIDITTSLKSTYGFTPNEAFDVAEQQANGTVVSRTFQAKYSVKLEKKVNAVFQNEFIKHKGMNALGQYEFVTVNLSDVKNDNKLSTIGKIQTTTTSLPQNNTANKVVLGNKKVIKGSKTLAAFGGLALKSVHKIDASEENNSNNSIGYGTLPPTPPDVINNLQKDMNYRFTVTATLYELKNNNWSVAKDNSGQNVIQKKVVNFRTGAKEIFAVNKSTKHKLKK